MLYSVIHLQLILFLHMFTAMSFTTILKMSDALQSFRGSEAKL